MAYPDREIPRFTRRRASQLFLAGTAALFVPQLVETPELALAQAYPDNQTTWPIVPTDLWYPSKPGRTNNGGNLYKPGGPLDVYDQANGTNIRGHLEGIYQEKNARGELTSSSGFCWATANVNLRLGYLEAAGIITLQQATDVRADENRFGLLVAMSAGDVCKRATWNEAHGPGVEDVTRNNDENLNFLAKEGQAFVAKMRYLPGDWYFVVRGIEGNQIWVSGFGFTAKMSMHNIINSYLPIRFHEAKKLNLPATLLYEQTATRYSVHKDVNFDEAKAAQLTGIPSY